MDKPDVRALAEDVPAEVRALARKTWDEAPVAECHADVEEMIAGAIMADRRATRETAKAEATTSNSEAVASEGDGLQDFRTTDTAALQQAADSLLHADRRAWEKGFTADDALVRHIAQARFQIGRVLQPVAAAKAEGRRQGMEEAARSPKCPHKSGTQEFWLWWADFTDAQAQSWRESDDAYSRSMAEFHEITARAYRARANAPAIRAIAQKAEG